MVDEGKGRPNPSRDRNEGKHRRRTVEKSCVTFLLCHPGWCIHKSDVQNKCDDDTHTHTHTHIYTVVPIIAIVRGTGTPAICFLFVELLRQVGTTRFLGVMAVKVGFSS